MRKYHTNSDMQAEKSQKTSNVTSESYQYQQSHQSSQSSMSSSAMTKQQPNEVARKQDESDIIEETETNSKASASVCRNPHYAHG